MEINIFRYYFPSTKKIEGQYVKYDAIELALSFIEGSYYLSILPTVYIESKSGQEIGKLSKQFEINKTMSGIYNLQYDQKLKDLQRKIAKKNDNNEIVICFKYKDSNRLQERKQETCA